MSNITDEHVSYVGRYGGTCRDCADENGVCPSSGLPCAESKKAIGYVLRALDYGVTHGYIANPFAATPQQPAQAELLQALVAATDLLHGTVKSSDRPSDYVMRAVAGFRALIAKAAAIQAPVIDELRALLSTNPKSEPATASAAPALKAAPADLATLLQPTCAYISGLLASNAELGEKKVARTIMYLLPLDPTQAAQAPRSSTRAGRERQGCAGCGAL